MDQIHLSPLVVQIQLALGHISNSSIEWDDSQKKSIEWDGNL
jgi:hypothetical protein